MNSLGGGSSTQTYLSQLLSSLESYYHPANTGKYILKLTEFLARLVDCFIKRVHRERHRKPSWGYRAPASAQLTDEDVLAAIIAGMIHDYDHPGAQPHALHRPPLLDFT